MLIINEYSLIVNVGVVTGKLSQFRVGLRAGGEPFPVGAFLHFASEQIGSIHALQNPTTVNSHRKMLREHKSLEALRIPYPESFGPLDTTAINNFSLLVGKGVSGKYAIQNFQINVTSDLQLRLWDQPLVQLNSVALDAGYQADKGFNFKFGAKLQINEHILATLVGYNTLQDSGNGIMSGSGTTTASSTRTVTSSGDNKGLGWFVQATYEGDIDLLAIARKLAGLDVGDKVSRTHLPTMNPGEKGIVIKNLALTLRKGKSAGGAIYLAADTDWSVFKHIEFAATFEAWKGWGFCLSMTLKDNLLALIPLDCAQDFAEYVEVNNTVVALYVGKVDLQRAGLSSSKKLPPSPPSSFTPSSGMQLKLSVSTQFKMTGKFGIIRKWVGKGQLDVVGELGTEGIGLGVKIGQVQLLKNDKTGEYGIEIDGRFDLQANKNGLQVGLIADMKIRSSFISEDLIEVEQTGFVVQLADGGVGFQAAIKGTLRNLFKVSGLEARGLTIKGVFSLAESGVPEELSFIGDIGLATLDNIKGQYVCQQSSVRLLVGS
jgi:hypothetical protein